ncbi:hypothetical protein K7G98_14845 [Saccharothrix sp. MB29]|nr:hypothetical protein [Saccharothrix sp. MB29]
MRRSADGRSTQEPVTVPELDCGATWRPGADAVHANRPPPTDHCLRLRREPGGCPT